MTEEKKQSFLIPMLKHRQADDFEIQPESKLSQSNSTNSRLYIEKKTKAEWIGTRSRPQENKPGFGRYYEEYRKWLGLAIYELLGVPTLPTEFSLQVAAGAQEDSDQEYKLPDLHVMSQCVPGIISFNEGFVENYIKRVKEGGSVKISVNENSKITLKSFGATHAIASFILDLDWIGEKDNKLGFIIQERDGKLEAQSIKIVADSALKFLEDSAIDPGNRQSSPIPKLLYDQLQPADKKEFIETAKRILLLPTATLKTLIDQVISEDGYTQKQAEQLLYLLLERKFILLEAFASEVSVDLLREAHLVRDRLASTLTNKFQSVKEFTFEMPLLETDEKKVKGTQFLAVDSGKDKLDKVMPPSDKIEDEKEIKSVSNFMTVQDKKIQNNLPITTSSEDIKLPDMKSSRSYVSKFPQLASIAEASKPYCFRLPMVDAYFTGRAEFLNHLAAQLHNEHPILVIQGDKNQGGIGKTQLAARYAELASRGVKCGDQNLYYHAVLWLHAEYDLASQFIDLAEELCNRSNVSVAEAVSSVYGYIKDKRALIIFDNVSDLNKLDPFLPPAPESDLFSHSSHIILIGDNLNLELLPRITLQKFSLEETQRYIRRKCPQANENEINNLADTLANLPLALSQATTFIRNNNITLANYNRLLVLQLFSLNDPYTSIKNPNDVLYTIFLLNKFRLTDQYPCIALMLKIAACVASEGIPLSLLQENLSISAPSLKIGDITQGLRALIDHGLLQHDTYGDLSIHKLTQQAVLKQLSTVEQHQLLEHVLQFIACHVEMVLDQPIAKKFFPHLWALIQCSDNRGRPEDHHLAKVISLLGHIYYSELGEKEQARELLERALLIQQKNLNDKYLQISKTPKELDDTTAEKLQQQCSALEKDTLITQIKLSDIYGALKNIDKQCSLLENSLQIQEKYYKGDREYKQLDTLFHLGDTYSVLKETHKLRDLLEKTLSIQKRHYKNEEKKEVADTLIKLSKVHGVLGDAQKQCDLLQQALPIEKKYCGESDRMEVINVLFNLSEAKKKLGYTQEQCDLLEEALSEQNKLYDTQDHEDIARTLIKLGNAYNAHNFPDKALSALTQALLIQKKLYGSRHQQLQDVMESLSICYKKLDNWSEEHSLLKKLLIIRKDLYGLNHSHVLMTSARLAVNLKHLKKDENALSAAQQVCGILISDPMYGKEHSFTKKILSYLTRYGFTSEQLFRNANASGQEKNTDRKPQHTSQNMVPIGTNHFLSPPKQNTPIQINAELFKAILGLVYAITTEIQKKYPAGPWDRSAPVNITMHVIDACVKGSKFEPVDLQLIPTFLVPALHAYIKQHNILLSLNQQEHLADKVKTALRKELHQSPLGALPDNKTKISAASDEQSSCLIM